MCFRKIRSAEYDSHLVFFGKQTSAFNHPNDVEARLQGTLTIFDSFAHVRPFNQLPDQSCKWANRHKQEESNVIRTALAAKASRCGDDLHARVALYHRVTLGDFEDQAKLSLSRTQIAPSMEIEDRKMLQNVMIQTPRQTEIEQSGLRGGGKDGPPPRKRHRLYRSYFHSPITILETLSTEMESWTAQASKHPGQESAYRYLPRAIRSTLPEGQSHIEGMESWVAQASKRLGRKTSFFDLPLEIRLKIYGYTFPKKLLLVHPGRRTQRYLASVSRSGLTPTFQLPHGTSKISGLNLQLFEVSKRVHAEATEYFYVNTKFLFAIGVTLYQAEQRPTVSKSNPGALEAGLTVTNHYEEDGFQPAYHTWLDNLTSIPQQYVGLMTNITLRLTLPMLAFDRQGSTARLVQQRLYDFVVQFNGGEHMLKRIHVVMEFHHPSWEACGRFALDPIVFFIPLAMIRGVREPTLICLDTRRRRRTRYKQLEDIMRSTHLLNKER